MLRILAYHRVAELRDTPAVDSRTVSATPEGFAQQMEHLARYYRIVSMPEVLEAVEKGRADPGMGSARLSDGNRRFACPPRRADAPGCPGYPLGIVPGPLRYPRRLKKA